MIAILSNQTSRAVIGTVTVFVVLTNLVVKALIEQWLPVGGAWWLVEDRIGLERLNNSGIAFGIKVGSGMVMTLIVLMALAALIWLVLTGALGHSRSAAAATGLIIGGALGNALDRLPDGIVTDYVALWSWPRFNVADAALTIGIMLFLFIEFSKTRQIHA